MLDLCVSKKAFREIIMLLMVSIQLRSLEGVFLSAKLLLETMKFSIMDHGSHP